MKMSKDDKKLETEFFKTKEEQSKVEKAVNNFLRLLKYDYLVLSAYYSARAKFPNNTTIYGANNHFLFYDYVGQIFKNAAKEVDTTFSFSSATTNYFISNLKQIYKDIFYNNTAFDAESFTEELNGYVYKLSNLIAKSGFVLKNWKSPHINSDNLTIDKAIKENEEALNKISKQFTNNLGTVAELSFFNDLDLVFNKFTNGKISIFIRSDDVIETVENLKFTNNMISVFKAFFVFKSIANEKIASSYTLPTLTLNFILRHFLHYITESSYYSTPEKYKTLKENCTFKGGGGSNVLRVITPDFKNLVFFNLTYRPSTRFVSSLEKGLIDFNFSINNLATIFESIHTTESDFRLPEASYVNFVSITWNKDYLSEKGIKSALFLTDLDVKKEAILELLKRKENLKNKLQAYVAEHKKDLIRLLELRTVQNLISNKIESVSAFCKKQLDLLHNKINKEEPSIVQNISALQNSSNFKKDYNSVKDLLFEASTLTAETSTKNKIRFTTENVENILNPLAFDELKEDNNLYFNLNKVIKDLFLEEHNYTERIVNDLMQRYWALHKVFKIFSISSGYVYDRIKDMELDRNQFLKGKTENLLASVIAELTQKLYDKNVSVVEFNKLLTNVIALVQTNGLSGESAQPPELASTNYDLVETEDCAISPEFTDIEEPTMSPPPQDNHLLFGGMEHLNCLNAI